VLSLEACLVTTKTPPIIRCTGARESEREPPKSGKLTLHPCKIETCNNFEGDEADPETIVSCQELRDGSEVRAFTPTKNWDWGRRHSWACWRRGETSGCHENALMFFLSTPKNVPLADPLLFHGIFGGPGGGDLVLLGSVMRPSIDHSDASHQPTYLIATCLTSSNGKVTKSFVKTFFTEWEKFPPKKRSLALWALPRAYFIDCCVVLCIVQFVLPHEYLFKDPLSLPGQVLIVEGGLAHILIWLDLDSEDDDNTWIASSTSFKICTMGIWILNHG